MMLAPDSIADWSAEPDIPALKQAYSLVGKDRGAAIRALENLADRGSAMAMIYLGGQYSGSVPENLRDIEKAIYWYEMAFARGSVVSTYYLGEAYLRSGKRDKAMDVLRSGENKKFVLAMWLLGVAHYQGPKGQKNLHEAERVWSEAAALGHVRSKRHLAHLYMCGSFGMWKIPKGMMLFVEAILNAMCIARRNPKSDLLKG